MSTFVIDGDKKQNRRIFPRKIISALDYMLSEIQQDPSKLEKVQTPTKSTNKTKVHMPAKY